jgi:hypothetical protein
LTGDIFCHPTTENARIPGYVSFFRRKYGNRTILPTALGYISGKMKICFSDLFSIILRAIQFCALPVSIEKGIRPHAFFPVG